MGAILPPWFICVKPSGARSKGCQAATHNSSLLKSKRRALCARRNCPKLFGKPLKPRLPRPRRNARCSSEGNDLADGNNVVGYALRESTRNGKSAAKRLSNGERQETVRDGMGEPARAYHSALPPFNIQSGPCESSAECEEGPAEMRDWRAPRTRPPRRVDLVCKSTNSAVISPFRR